MHNKHGMAIVVVLFFSFSIAIILFFMLQSNTNLAYQNKKTLAQMQAYYLAHSGLQHAKLQLRLLPKESYEFFAKNGAGNAFADIDSGNYPPTAMRSFNAEKSGYNLFKPGKALDNMFPYGGRYYVDSIALMGSHDKMKMVQDSYKLVVKAEVDVRSETFTEELVEELIVSRFTGGIK